MEVQLTIEQPNGPVAEHRFTEEPVTVGSALANHVVIEDAELAPHQLIIFRENDEWVVRNLADGVEIALNHQPLNKGETRPLGHEADLRMGRYGVVWYSEAAPRGAPKELARPAAPAATRAPTVETVVPDTGWTPVSDAPSESVPAVPSAPARTAAESVAASVSEEAASMFGSAPVAPAAADALAEEASEMFNSVSASLDAAVQPESIAPEPALAPPLMPEMPRRPEPAPEPVAASDSAMLGGASTPDLSQLEAVIRAEEGVLADTAAAQPPLKMETPAPRRRKVAVAAHGCSRVTVHGYARMRPFRAYPLLVNVTQGDGQAVASPGAATYVRLVPCFPGCVVTPTSARLDLGRAANGMKFWITPVAVGRHKDAWVDITWQGSAPARLRMPCRVLTPWVSRLLFLLTVFTAGLAFLPGFMDWNVTRIIEKRLPEQLTPHVVGAIDAVGGVVYLGLAFSGLCLLLSAWFYVLRRPRSVTLTAAKPGA